MASPSGTAEEAPGKLWTRGEPWRVQKVRHTMITRKSLATLLLISAAGRADVQVFSTFPNDMTVRYQSVSGESRQATLSSMQATSLSSPDKPLQLTVLDAQGNIVFQGQAANHRYFVLSPAKERPAALTEAGSTRPGPNPPKVVNFFNANGFPVILEMFAITGDDRLTNLTVGANEASGPSKLPEGTFRLFLKDEGGNPIGKCYSYVKTGNFYLIYRKRPTLFDLEQLGTVPSDGK